MMDDVMPLEDARAREAADQHTFDLADAAFEQAKKARAEALERLQASRRETVRARLAAGVMYKA